MNDKRVQGSVEPERGIIEPDPDRDVRAERGHLDRDEGFLPPDRMQSLRDRWTDVQAGFVDDPRAAVEEAQALVERTTSELTEMFARERASLETQWKRGDEADTEELRVALQRYRSFFNRLLRTERERTA
jgi:hypothetical protein